MNSKLLLLFVAFLLPLTLKANETERIIHFHSDIQVATDGKITVSETIKLYGGVSDIRRGIVRSIPLYRTDSQGAKKRMDVNVLSVERDGKPEPFYTEDANNHREIFIGDRDYYLQPGEYEYLIAYESYGHVGFFDDHDEIYWNVTGDEWAFEIEKATATVALPDDATVTETSCYSGAYGTSGSNCSATADGNRAMFEMDVPLQPKEGFTVNVSFPRDIIQRPAPPTKAALFWQQYKTLISSVLCLAMMLCYCYRTWRKVGVDPEKPVVIPTFDPPHGWSAATSRYLYRLGYDNKVFTAALISMAVKGSIRITHDKKKYAIEKTGKREGLSPEENRIYDALFVGGPSLTVSDSNHTTFSSANNKLKSSLSQAWVIKDYLLRNIKYIVYTTLLLIALVIFYIILTGEGSSAVFVLFLSPFIIVGAVAISMGVKPGQQGCARIFTIIFGLGFLLPGLASAFLIFLEGENLLTTIFLIAMLAVYAAYIYLIKAPTPLGVQVKAELEGFRMYMKTAEENRLNLLTPPERTPELFEKLLPYAIALNVENEWSEKFDSVLSQANYVPQWYADDKPFRYNDFAPRLNTFSSSVGSARVDPSSKGSSGSGGWSSGSSGGGFSGGGGGGGGGRGW